LRISLTRSSTTE